ncbi:MAG: hypothetical protein EOM70_04315 [Clostridia bacterium]|nr:hypothetical protein [Clostridia bacterium]
MKRFITWVLTVFFMMLIFLPMHVLAAGDSPPPPEPYQKVVAKKGNWYSNQVAYDNRSNLVVGYTGSYDTRVEEPALALSINERTLLTGIHIPFEGAASDKVELMIKDSQGNVYQGFTARSEATGSIREASALDTGELETANTLYTFVPDANMALPRGDYVLELNGEDLPVDAYLVKGYNQAAYERYQESLVEWSQADEINPNPLAILIGSESLKETYDQYGQGKASEEPSWPDTPAERLAPTFQLDEESVIDEVILSMWNGGEGIWPGLVSILDESGNEVASFQAQGASQGDVANGMWVILPGLTLPAGIYQIVPDAPEALDYDETGEPVFSVSVSQPAAPPASFTGTYHINLDVFKTSTLMGPVIDAQSSFSLRDHELVVLDKGRVIELVSQYEGMPFSQNCVVTERTDDTVTARLQFSADLSNLPYAAKIGADALVTLMMPQRGLAQISVGGTGTYQRSASSEKGADFNTYDVRLEGAMTSKDLPPFVMAVIDKTYGAGNIPGPDTPFEAAAGMLFPPLAGVLVNALQNALKPKAKVMRDKEWYKKKYPGRTDEQLAMIMMADALGASGGDAEDAESIGDNERPGGADYVAPPEPAYSGQGGEAPEEPSGEDLSFGKPDVPAEKPAAAATQPMPTEPPAAPAAPVREPAEPEQRFEPETRTVPYTVGGSTIDIERDPVTGGWIKSEDGQPFDLEAHQRNLEQQFERHNDYRARNEELERTGQTAMQQKLAEIKQEYEQREALVDWMRRMQNVAMNRGMGEKGEIDDMYSRLGAEINRVDSGESADFDKIARIRTYIGGRIEGDLGGPKDTPDVESINWTNRELWSEAFEETGRNLSQVTNKDGSLSWKGLAGRTAIGLLTGGTSEYVFTPMGSVYTMKDAIDRGESGLSAAAQGIQQAVVQYGVGKVFGAVVGTAGGAAKGAVKGALSGGLKGSVGGGLKGGWQGLKSAGSEMAKEGSDLFSRQAWSSATQKMGQSMSGGAKRIGNILTGREGYAGAAGIASTPAVSATSAITNLSPAERLKLNQFNEAVRSGDPAKVSSLYKNGGMKDLANLQQKGAISPQAAQQCNQALRSQVTDSIRKGTHDAINDIQKTTRVRVEEVIVGDSGSSAKAAVTRLKTDFDRTLVPKFNQADLKAYASRNNMSVSEAYDDLCKQFTNAHEANVSKALGQKGLDANAVGFKSYDRIGSASGQADSYAEGFTNARQAASGSGEVFKVRADGSIRSYQTSGQAVVDQNQLNKALYKTGDLLDNPTAVPPREVPSIIHQQMQSISKNPSDPLTIAKAVGRTEKGANLLVDSLQDPKLTRAASEIYENPGRTSEILKKFGFTDAAGNADPSKFCQAGREAVTRFDQSLKSIQPGT